jgi:hypothetical protein
MKISRIVAVAFVLGLAGPAALAQAEAEQMKPLTWLSFEMAAPGSNDDLIRLRVEDTGPMLDGLMESGTLASWGIAIPITHSLDDTWNHVVWATMSDWSKVSALQAGFEGLFRSRTPEQAASVEKAYRAAVVEGSHHDAIVRHLKFGASADAPKPRYLMISRWRANPGKDQQLAALYEEIAAPVMEKLLAAGTISGFGMYVSEIHTGAEWTHTSWYSMAELSAIDAMDAELQSAIGPLDMQRWQDASDWSGHRDQVLMIVHTGGPDGEE